MTKLQNRIAWAAQILAAVILLQTLFFKFTASEESVYIFTQVGAEPLGRIGSGIVELIAGVLLLIPRLAWAGALLALGVMAGAILSHLTVLGIEVLGDGGQLFAYALITFVCCATVLVIRRRDVPLLNLR
ncbi:MAG: DoxX family protein [Sphingobacteriaceae bacterium]|nr:DoxX family protein [Cytophagaceae bacterium]